MSSTDLKRGRRYSGGLRLYFANARMLEPCDCLLSTVYRLLPYSSLIADLTIARMEGGIMAAEMP